jgi:hypothetical protein
MRAYSAAHFEFDDVLTLTWPDAEAKLQSEYTGGDDGRAYPVTIHGEIRGNASSLEEAQTRLSGAIGNTLPLVALASNAAIADPLAVAVYGLELSTPQPFMGYRTPSPADWFPPGKRRIDAEATLALMSAVGQHPQSDLLHRAIESYRRALGHWFPEEQLLAGEFLFICAETLSRFAIESRAAARGITPKNLVRLDGSGTETKFRWRYLNDEVFAGDTAALDALKEASDGFEHGYMAFEDARKRQEPVLERAFACMRRALIGAAEAPDEMADRPLADSYVEPRALVPVLNIVRGELKVKDLTRPVPALDGAAIELDWQVSEPTASRRPDGEVDITFRRRVTARRLPDNVSLTISSIGMRAAHVVPSDAEPLQVEVERASGDTISHEDTRHRRD